MKYWARKHTMTGIKTRKMDNLHHDNLCMQLAIDEAWKYQGLTYPNPAVGAAITYNGKIISIEAHQKAGSAHAEILVLLSAYEVLSGNTIDFNKFDASSAHDFLLDLYLGFFSDCTIYVTLEPCSHIGKTPSCAQLLEKLHLQRVVVGTSDPIANHSGGSKLFANITMGVLEKECRDLIEPFVIWQKRAFVLFKLAQTSNGKIGGGYLSSKASLKHVHQLREACDTLLIGGNTVREDRPTLDCRFIDAKAPNIIIYSHEDNFDREIPLFDIPNREVTVSNNLEFLEQPSFVIVEGGEGMMRAIINQIDWLLLYQAPKISTNNVTYHAKMDLEFLHQSKKEIDITIWSRKIGN